LAKETFSIEFAGRTLTVETGQVAKQANGAVVVRYGDTTVCCWLGRYTFLTSRYNG